MSRRRLAPVLGAALALVVPAAAHAADAEPKLLARALYPATEYQPGPVSGNSGVTPANGITPPFAGQPIPGISGAVWNDDGTVWGQPDNGFGTKDNSADFLLRIYRSARTGGRSGRRRRG